MNYLIKVETDDSGGIDVDTVEQLLSRQQEGHKLAVFADDGTIIFCDPDLADFSDGVPGQ